MATVELPVTAGDGAGNTLVATAEEALPADAPVVLVKPALGVRASYYAPLFDAFAPLGMRVVTADWRGHGRSSVRPTRSVDFGYLELLELDFPAELDAIEERFPGAPIALLGHSMGGQLSFLQAAAAPERIRAVLAIATCSVYWREYGPGGSYGVLFLTQLTRWLGAVWGTFPGHRLGFGGKEARTLMRDWSGQARTGAYRPAGSAVDYEALLAASSTPGLILTLAGDRFAPPRAAAHLAGKMPAGVVEHRHLEQPRISNAHFRWVAEIEALFPAFAPWLEGLLASPSASAT